MPSTGVVTAMYEHNGYFPMELTLRSSEEKTALITLDLHYT